MRNRKVIPGIIITVMLLFLISCEKEKPLDEAILGKWEVVSMNQITFESNVKKAELIVYLEANEMKYQFIDGGSGIFWDKEEDFLFSWTLSGSQITISDLYEKDLVVNASVDDDILTWTNKDTDPQMPNRSYEYVMTAERLSK